MALLLGERPDHIKVFLRKRDRYADGFGRWRLGGGIDPALLPLIAELSEEAGVRQAVANSNIHDFRASLNAGADIITHLHHPSALLSGFIAVCGSFKCVP